MHRLIMTSNTYRQSSVTNEVLQQRDPEGELLSRYPLKRMNAEALRDSMLFVSGRLDETPFGPPDSVTVRGDGLVTVNGTADGWRRSIYARQRRTEIPTILENFDLPQMNPNCLGRSNSTVAPQALYLMNNELIHQLSRSLAKRVAQEVGTSQLERIKRLYLLTLSRHPTPEETKLALETYQQLTLEWTEQLQDAQTKTDQPDMAALPNLCHAILNSADYIYID